MAEVRIEFSNLDGEQLKHLHKAEQELRLAGIHFDRGHGCGVRDWEFDWSLHGANVVFKKA